MKLPTKIKTKANAKAKTPAKTKAAQRATPRRAGITYIALLRGINVGGNKRVPMQTLRRLAGELGFRHVETYIQSGNMVLVSELAQAEVERALERALLEEFGFAVDVVVRTQAAWQAYAARSAFREAERERPHLLLLGLAKQRALAGAEGKLSAYAKAGERLRVLADALWIDFPAGIARSKLSPAVLDRLVGSAVTARNWRTVQQLAELAAAASALELARMPTQSK